MLERDRGIKMNRGKPAPRPDAPRLAAALLGWYDRHRRHLPWRAEPGASADPYKVWVSEIMLQQTTVAAVGPYFQRFVERWPSVAELAGAPLDDVLRLWQGLGYYARARNLHRAARAIVAAHGGRLPDSEAALLALPGIGTYTAAAIAAIAFDRRAAAVDGNVERVMARLNREAMPLPAAKARLRAQARALVPEARAGDFAQAMMDLGALVCTPRAPRCGACPWQAACRARAAGDAEALPRRAPKRARPLRHGVAFWLSDGKGRVLLRRREERGLLGGMMEIPSTRWSVAQPSEAESRAAAPARARWRVLPGLVRHGFTHFELALSVWSGRAARADGVEGLWWRVDRLWEQALPTAMKKIVRHVAQAAAAPERREKKRRRSRGIAASATGEGR
jgi:A/G-specific adenine glycosylase